MRTHHFPVSMTVLLVLLQGLPLAAVSRAERTPDLGLAKVKTVHGDVQVVVAESGKTWPVLVNSFVFEGDVVHTGQDGTTSLQFADGSRLTVMPDSVLAMRELHTGYTDGRVATHVDLQQGRVETQVVPLQKSRDRFEISTPAGITSVRGTDFRVGMDAQQSASRTEVLHGLVDVGSGGASRKLPGGFGTIAAAGKSPIAPVGLLPAPDMQKFPVVFDRVPIQFNAPTLAGAVAYRAQIAVDPGFTDVVYDRRFPSEAIDGSSLPDGEYQLRLRGIDANGLEGYNGQRHFTLNARPRAPALTEPANGAKIQDALPKFAWTAESTAEYYHFQLARDERFKDLVANIENVQGASLLPPQPLLPGDYYWRVASMSEQEGYGPFSGERRSFQILPPPAKVPADAAK